MRLGISTSLNNMTPEKWAEKMVQIGCKSIVFPVDCTADDKLIDEYVKLARENDLLIAEVGIWRNAISPDENERKKNLEYSINQLKLAEYIGANCCVNVAGSTGKRWDGAYKDNFHPDTWKRTVEMVQTIIDTVNPRNTYFSLEPMPWMIPTGPEEYRKLIEDVGRERFAVHMDIINMINSSERFFWHDEFVDRVFDWLGPRIRSCHIKDVKLLDGFTFQLRECACGEGDFNLEHYCERINKINPDMPVIIEHLSDDNAYFESMEYAKRRFNSYI